MAAKLKPKLVVIVGQTATGKSYLAIKIAEKYNGEIIAADSRTIYKHTNIGTAKPSSTEMTSVPHYLIDVIEPDQTYSASEFKKQANGLIDQISEKGKLPIVVGGTGLYINSLIYDYKFGSIPNKERRQNLENLSIEKLQKKTIDIGLNERQINYKNKRHLIRAIENNGVLKTASKLRTNTLLLGISVDQQVLKDRIIRRNEQMINSGLEREVKQLSLRYDWDTPGMNSIGYKEWKGYFDGEYDLSEVRKKLFTNNWQYARRQKIWFKRDKNIQWSTSVDTLIRQLDQFLIQ